MTDTTIKPPAQFFYCDFCQKTYAKCDIKGCSGPYISAEGHPVTICAHCVRAARTLVKEFDAKGKPWR